MFILQNGLPKVLYMGDRLLCYYTTARYGNAMYHPGVPHVLITQSKKSCHFKDGFL